MGGVWGGLKTERRKIEESTTSSEGKTNQKMRKCKLKKISPKTGFKIRRNLPRRALYIPEFFPRNCPS